MSTITNFCVWLVSALHVGFLILEMFFWDKFPGLQIFEMQDRQQFATASKSLAANQGLYNGFLAAGLAWGLLSHDTAIQVFFLICVIIAGLFGGFTSNRKILLAQALPGAVALALVWLS
ncbi:MAG: DUF1304 domain-containing protein [Acidobacteria bacterium]|nr:DUF1304 domain-containing protein [Acidobacteriota bacterium]